LPVMAGVSPLLPVMAGVSPLLPVVLAGLYEGTMMLERPLLIFLLFFSFSFFFSLFPFSQPVVLAGLYEGTMQDDARKAFAHLGYVLRLYQGMY